jgi:hypothetical protein
MKVARLNLIISKPNEKLTFDYVGQPLTLNPPASLNLFKLSYFGVGNACSNSGRLLVKIWHGSNEGHTFYAVPCPEGTA